MSDLLGVDRATAERYMPKDIPAGWSIAQRSEDGMALVHARPGAYASVILSVAREQDGRLWLHASMSCASRPPTWDELRWVKDWAIGDRYAYVVFPPASMYVNIDAHALHLWAPLEGEPPLPEFSRGMGTI